MTEEYPPPFTPTPLAPSTGADPLTTPIGTGFGATTDVGYENTASYESAGDYQGAAGSDAGSDGGSDSAPRAEVAKNQAAEVGQGAVQAGQHVGSVAKDQAANVTAEAGKQAKDLLQQARSELSDQAGQQQQRLASGLRALGDELHSMAHHSEQGGVATDLARQASSKSHEIAGWLDEREPGRLLDEVKSFARQRPGAFLVLAAGAGLLGGRMTRGLKESTSGPSESQQDVAQVQAGGYSDADYYGSATEPARPYASSEDQGLGFPTAGGAL